MASNEQIQDQQELDALMSPEPVAPVQRVPVSIHTTSGRTFVVADIGAWQYQELGIFAQGLWSEELCERGVAPRQVLIPYERIEYLEFDFDALERFEAAQEADDGDSPSA